MNGLQRRTPALELSGVAITATMALTIQRVTAPTTAFRLAAATASLRLDPYFM